MQETVAALAIATAHDLAQFAAHLRLQENHFEYGLRPGIGRQMAQRADHEIAKHGERVVGRFAGCGSKHGIERQRGALTHRREKRRLVLEVPIHGTPGHSGRGGHFGQRRARDAPVAKDRLGRV